MVNKAIELLRIQENSKAKDALQMCVRYKKKGLETLFLANLEGLVNEIGGNLLEKKQTIDLRKKLNIVVETIVEGKEKTLTLFEQYFTKNDVSGVKTISKDLFKFKEPERDTSGVLEIKKSEFRFQTDKIRENEKLKSGSGGLI